MYDGACRLAFTNLEAHPFLLHPYRLAFHQKSAPLQRELRWYACTVALPTGWAREASASSQAGERGPAA